MGTGSVGKVVASTGTPGVAVKEAGVANTHQPHQKSPPWVHHGGRKLPAVAHPRKRKEKDMKIKGTFK